MYHYVRDYENTRYPYIKGLDVRDFEFQIQYLNSKYNVLNPKEVHQIVEQGKNFKAKDCWLTFDDGYIDHYNYVLPLLERYKLKASFFPPVVTTQHKTVLDFNKIHFVLANNNNHDFILHDHMSLVNLLKENQNNEIMRAVDFWKKNKLIKDKFTICYPYGSYNSDTLSILSENNCLIGLTTKVGPVLEKSYTPLELPRIDTNDFPQKLSEINNKIY